MATNGFKATTGEMMALSKHGIDDRAAGLVLWDDWARDTADAIDLGIAAPAVWVTNDRCFTAID